MKFLDNLDNYHQVIVFLDIFHRLAFYLKQMSRV
jgi:hypothetical protein